jgi:hypothetical protein
MEEFIYFKILLQEKKECKYKVLIKKIWMRYKIYEEVNKVEFID